MGGKIYKRYRGSNITAYKSKAENGEKRNEASMNIFVYLQFYKANSVLAIIKKIL